MKQQTYLPLDELIQQLEHYPGLTVTIKGGTAERKTFEEWATVWLHTFKRGQVKDNTYQGTYREPIEGHLIPHFGRTDLREIKPIHIQEFFNMQANLYAEETLKKQRSALRGIFQVAVENGLCDVSPVTSSLKVWSTVSPVEKQAWTQDEYNIAHAFAAEHRFGTTITILMETGISRSELLGLTWSDFDADKSCLYLRNGLIETRNSRSGEWQLQHDGLKNHHRRRTIPLSAELTERLKRVPRWVWARSKSNPGKIPTQYIAHSPTGKAFAPQNWYKRQFKVFMKELHSEYPGVRILTPHELRHTRATLLVQGGANLYAVARMFGWSDLAMMSRRYLHDDLEAMRQALFPNKIDT